jgi:hypothetical protein
MIPAGRIRFNVSLRARLQTFDLYRGSLDSRARGVADIPLSDAPPWAQIRGETGSVIRTGKMSLLLTARAA